MGNEINFFDNNHGIGGFENGLYDSLAVHPAEANWTRQSRLYLPLKCDLLWKTCVKGTSINQSYGLGSFAVDKDNNVIISDNDASLGGPHYGRIFLIKNSSEVLELFRFNKALGSPVLGNDGNIYIATRDSKGTKDNKLFCLKQEGEIIWGYTTVDPCYCRPVIDKEGNIYIYAYSDVIGTLYSVNKEGKLNWSHKFNSINWYEPIITANGEILLGLNVMQTLCAFHKNGTMLWEKKIGQGLGKSPAIINTEGIIYACISDMLYALYPNGDIKWTYSPKGGYVFTSPAMDKDGNLYVGISNTRLAAISSEGKEIWQAKTNGVSIIPPLIDDIQRVCLQSFMRYKYNADDISWIEIFSHEGKKMCEYKFSGSVMSTVIAKDNIIYTTAQHHKTSTKKGEVKVNSYWDLLAIG